MTKLEEIWKSVPGIEKYQVSNLGRVKNSITGAVIKGSNNKGYLRVEFWSKAKNKKERIFVHRMVLMAFVANPESKPCANHKNGIRSDNRIENLEWCTAKENTNHAIKTGLCCIGSKKHNSKLTESDITIIRRMIRNGIPKTEIAYRFSVDPTTIGRIGNGKSWSHVTFETSTTFY